MLLFSLKLHWLPSYGAGSLKHFILPTLTVCMGSAAGLLRLTRSAMLETVRQEYIRTAKAKELHRSASSGSMPFVTPFFPW